MLLSNRDDWETRHGWIQEQGTEGREAVQGAMRELEAAGYITHAELPREAGRITGHVWHIYDSPRPIHDRTNQTRHNGEISKSLDSPDYGNPDAGSPDYGKPESGKPDAGKPATKKEQGKKQHPTKETGEEQPPLALGGDVESFPAAALVEAWNRLCVSLPAITSIRGPRAKLTAARWAECKRSLLTWEERCKRLEASDFATGRAPGTDGRKWKATFDWFVHPGNFDKVVEGKYDNRPRNTDTPKNDGTAKRKIGWGHDRPAPV